MASSFFVKGPRMTSLRLAIRNTAWNSVIAAIIGGFIALRFFSTNPDFVWWQYLYAFFAASGLSFLVLFLLQSLFSVSASCFSKKAGSFVSFLILSLYFIALVSDTFVYQQYRFHINWAMIDLAINTDGQVISFSTGMIIQIALIVTTLMLLSAICVKICGKISEKKGALWPSLLLIFGYIVVNCVYAFSFAQNIRAITTLTERIPLYRPVRANSFFAKYGLVMKTEKVDMQEVASSTFDYPKAPLRFGEGQEKLNVLIVAVDCLRGDVVDPITTPNLYAIAQKSIVFKDHYSTGNATRAGVFGLFYSIPPLYWKYALTSNIPAVLIESFMQEGYAVSPFTSSTLNRPEFYATVFSNIRPLRMGSAGKSDLERDPNALKDFRAWTKDKAGKPFFGFLFFDGVHSYAVPDDDPTLPYKNYWEEVNHLKLGPDFDPEPYFNRYKNALYTVDKLIGETYKFLEKEGYLKNTVVIFTSDHGEEFNDSRLNYWGHNSNFSKAQIKIPLIIHWPGMTPQTIDYRTTAYDIAPTLMKRLLKVQNPLPDFSVGVDLFASGGRDVFISSSYLEDALVSGEEVLLIKGTGMMEGHRLSDWGDMPEGPMKKWLPYYLDMRGKYLD